MAGPLPLIGPAFAARLRRDTRGGTAMMFALALPAVLTVGLGAVDLASVHADKSRLQDTADAAALGAAKQLNIAEAVGIKARAEETVRGQLKDLDGRMTYEVTTTVSDDRTGVKLSLIHI